MSEMVKIEKLVKRFKNFTAVDNISFAVRKGEVLGFLGPNGAGKSTTMKVITGFLSADEGTVTVMGENIEQNPIATKKAIGYLPEGAPAYAEMTPAGFLDFIADIRGLSGSDKRKRLDAVAEQVNIKQVWSQPIETLSKGFKRRVGLAQAILHDPPVLILDEPTDGLDPNQKKEVRGLIRDMAHEKAIILSTHILEEVDAVCTRATIIAAGKIVADGTPRELEQQSENYNSVRLVLTETPPEKAKGKFAAMAGVDKVEITSIEDQTVLQVFPKDRKSIAHDIQQVLQAEKWETSEFHIDRGRLDDVFSRITQPKQAIS